MHLITPYAPGSFLKPVIIVSTIYNSVKKETALRFVYGLNVWHALEIPDHVSQLWPGELSKHERNPLHRFEPSPWIVIAEHPSEGAAIEYHMQLTKDFNHGTTEEWEAGWEPYLELYDKYCPAGFRDEWETFTSKNESGS